MVAGVAGMATPARATGNGLSVEVTVADANYNTLQGDDQIAAGEPIQITVAVSNAAGAATASNVRAGLWLPASLSYNQADNDPAGTFSEAARTVTWLGGALLGTITGGDSPHSMVVWVTANKAVTFSDLRLYAAVADAGGQLGDPTVSCVKPQCVVVNAAADPSPSEEPTTTPTSSDTPTSEPSDSPTTEPSGEPTASPTSSPSESADTAVLTVSVKAGAKSAAPGGSVSYVVTVTNGGTVTAQDVRLSLRLGQGLSVGAVRPAGVNNTAEGTFDVQLGDIPAGKSALTDVAVSVNTDAQAGDLLGLLAAAAAGEWSRPDTCSGTTSGCAAGQITVTAAATTSPSPTQTTDTQVDSGRPDMTNSSALGSGLLFIVGAAGLFIAAAPRPRRAQ